MPSATPAAAPPHGPAFLRALDHVLPTDIGWISQCPVFGCQRLLEITAGDTHWRFHCPDHPHDEVVDYLRCDVSIPLDAEATRKLWRAVMLAPALDVCEALLRGQHVPRTAMDPMWVRRFGL